MKIKIIKRAEQQKKKEKICAAEINQSNQGKKPRAAETIKLWIEDLKKKKEREQLSFRKLFVKEHSAKS